MNLSTFHILPSLSQIKDRTLLSLDIPQNIIDSIVIAKSPDPKMGDFGFPAFALARSLKKSPQMIAQELAESLNQQHHPLVDRWVPTGPYVNLFLNQSAISQLVLSEALHDLPFGSSSSHDSSPDNSTSSSPNTTTKWMIEFSAPNTNKPQHLGHVRNNLLGDVSARLLQFIGDDVVRVNLINDRGIHICKSMIAYQRFGNSETPDSTGLKGDHLVGKYYVRYNCAFKDEYQQWLNSDDAQACYLTWAENVKNPSFEAFASSFEDEYFNRFSPLGADTKEMLRLWEANDPDIRALWTKMNSWVFDGFDQTYHQLGISFDKVYKESYTYLLGKEIVNEGLEKGIFVKLDDGAVICDLSQVGMPNQQKVLLRSDGTTVYMTQDLGTALARFNDFPINQMVYVVGNEQEYHFNVLFKILGLLRPELKDHFYHLSYGMVELPDGKMKSREGTVVDADDLLKQTISLAELAVQERYDKLQDDELKHRAKKIALAGLKYHILDYNPKTTVHFDPKKSLEFQGRTGPYLLYCYARIQSILDAFKDHEQVAPILAKTTTDLTRDTELFQSAARSLTTPLEIDVIRELLEWPTVVNDAARQFEPNRVTEHLFRLAKSFSTLYNDPDHRLKEIEGERLVGLILVSMAVAKTLQIGLNLLGIETLDTM